MRNGKTTEIGNLAGVPGGTPEVVRPLQTAWTLLPPPLQTALLPRTSHTHHKPSHTHHKRAQDISCGEIKNELSSKCQCHVVATRAVAEREKYRRRQQAGGMDAAQSAQFLEKGWFVAHDVVTPEHLAAMNVRTQLYAQPPRWAPQYAAALLRCPSPCQLTRGARTV